MSHLEFDDVGKHTSQFVSELRSSSDIGGDNVNRLGLGT